MKAIKVFVLVALGVLFLAASSQAVVLRWTHPEPERVISWSLHWGQTSGQYTNVLEIDKDTASESQGIWSYDLELLPGRHYVALKANGEGVTSPFSNEGYREIILDTDQDGIAEQVDNCSEVPNPDQTDWDQDNFGDLCDCDYDQTGMCDLADLSIFGSFWGSPAPNDQDPPVIRTDVDFNKDRRVGVPDLGCFSRGFNKPPGPSAVAGDLLKENFETYSSGEDPNGWLDTGANNALTESGDLFQVREEGGEKFFSTTSTLVNIHSHRTLARPEANLDFTGRFRLTDSAGGLGITFQSQYPNQDAYYRIRYFGDQAPWNAPHLSPHGASTSELDCSPPHSPVTPSANVWYRFRIQTEASETALEIRARFWQENDEPTNWQIQCNDDRPERFLAGRVGVWSMGPGRKDWDDFQVRTLPQ